MVIVTRLFCFFLGTVSSSYFPIMSFLEQTFKSLNPSDLFVFLHLAFLSLKVNSILQTLILCDKYIRLCGTYCEKTSSTSSGMMDRRIRVISPSFGFSSVFFSRVEPCFSLITAFINVHILLIDTFLLKLVQKISVQKQLDA